MLNRPTAKIDNNHCENACVSSQDGRTMSISLYKAVIPSSINSVHNLVAGHGFNFFQVISTADMFF